MEFGDAPVAIGFATLELTEVMYYLYLPVMMPGSSDIRLPRNLEPCRDIIIKSIEAAPRRYEYAYISARKGWASPDNPLNRPGWHCDGFGTDDTNYVWWKGAGTRFAVQSFQDISTDHVESLKQFEAQLTPDGIRDSYPEMLLYELHPKVVHATPIVKPPGEMRQFVKVSLSDHPYNLENNSHNWLFDYDWMLANRNVARNDTHTAQGDYVEQTVESGGCAPPVH